jgi:hypothetical protein
MYKYYQDLVSNFLFFQKENCTICLFYLKNYANLNLKIANDNLFNI